MMYLVMERLRGSRYREDKDQGRTAKEVTREKRQDSVVCKIQLFDMQGSFQLLTTPIAHHIASTLG